MLIVQFCMSQYHCLLIHFHFHLCNESGQGAASKEKLIVFGYALLAMGLQRKAELASIAVRNKTGMDLNISD